MTPDEASAAAAELRDIVQVVRENLLWQAASGVVGVPRARNVRRLGAVDQAQEAGAAARRAPVLEPAEAPEERPLELGRARQEPAAPAHEPAAREVTAVVRVAPGKRLALLAELAEEVKGCTKCALHAGRTQTVFSRGNPSAELMIVGEGPGAEEDAQGEPFVGPAGQLLDRMVGAMGYERDEVYIANIVKCRPPNNRTPQVEEMAACLPYLHKQIEIVSPRVMLAMGNTAVRGLLGVSEGIMRLRGKWKLYKGRIPVMPTYHPAYLLRAEGTKRDAKREAWDDLKAVMGALGRSAPTKKG